MHYGPRVKGQAPASSAVLIRLTPAEYLKLADAAGASRRSMSNYAAHLVRQHLDTVRHEAES